MKFECSECLAIEETEKWGIGSQLLKKKLCFYCDFWLNDVGVNRKDNVVVEGNVYTVGPDRKDGMLGFGGREFRFRMLDDGREVVSHNVWLRGYVPKRFKDRFPDNAEILK